MRNNKKSVDVFIALIRSGLWGHKICLLPYGEIDYGEVFLLAKEQSVTGLVAVGLENVEDLKIQKKDAIPFIGQAYQLEQRNSSMNGFIANLFKRLEKVGVTAVLVKGQGVAQCYERPLWRSSGDVDLLLDEDNYRRCKSLLLPEASYVEREDTLRRHLGLTIKDWFVELHGTLRTGLRKVDEVVDAAQELLFRNEQFRIWEYQDSNILLPSPDNAVVFVFSHIIQHFYEGGIGFRQICDWCRLLWTFRSELNIPLLSERIRKMGLEKEWQLFGRLAVDQLGMPVDALPLYDPSRSSICQEKRLLSFILKKGNFGHNDDKSFLAEYPTAIRHFLLFLMYSNNTLQRFFIFPGGSIRAWLAWIGKGVNRVVLKKR